MEFLGKNRTPEQIAEHKKIVDEGKELELHSNQIVKVVYCHEENGGKERYWDPITYNEITQTGEKCTDGLIMKQITY